MITLTLILISIYLISCFSVYKYMQIAHSKNGIWKNQNTGGYEIFITFFPMINTVFGILSWIIEYPDRRKKQNYNSFFRIKK